MKTKTTYLMVILALLLNTASGAKQPAGILSNESSASEANAKFTLVRKDGNVSIYMRWIMVNETTPCRQLKAVFVINSPAEKIVSILRNEKSYTNWMKTTKICYRIKTINSYQWYSYVQFSVPWPLNNQDCILKYEVRTYEDLSRTVVTLVSQSNILKINKGIERISQMEGAWVITQLGPDKSSVEYYIYSIAELKFPSWLTDPLIQKNLINSMKSLNETVMKSSK